MKLTAPKGHRVILSHPERGFDIHQEAAAKWLDLGVTYTVQRVMTSMLYTKVWLQEVPNVEFNTLQFEDASEDA